MFFIIIKKCNYRRLQAFKLTKKITQYFSTRSISYCERDENRRQNMLSNSNLLIAIAMIITPTVSAGSVKQARVLQRRLVAVSETLLAIT